MRTLLVVGSVLLAPASGAALGQPAPSTGTGAAPSASPTSNASSPQEIQKLGAQYLTDCVNDWDRGTHMSKQDWARTCRRVVQRRIDYLRQQEK
jgi:hypothetical protein